MNRARKIIAIKQELIETGFQIVFEQGAVMNAPLSARGDRGDEKKMLERMNVVFCDDEDRMIDAKESVNQDARAEIQVGCKYG